MDTLLIARRALEEFEADQRGPDDAMRAVRRTLVPKMQH
jgi:hypothetical protein